jgi:hypothetical protein
MGLAGVVSAAMLVVAAALSKTPRSRTPTRWKGWAHAGVGL